MKGVHNWFIFFLIALPVLGAGFLGISYIQREFAIWSERKRGEAEYAHAEANRKIAILEAEAKKESAKALADAEVIRAEGIAKANAIIGSSLKGNDGYLRYLWIQGLQSNNNTTVYIPTECGLPMLEANRNK